MPFCEPLGNSKAQVSVNAKVHESVSTIFVYKLHPEQKVLHNVITRKSVFRAIVLEGLVQ